MKIAIVSFSDLNGGAAKAAYRLHTALNLNNIDSYMIVENKTTNEDKIIAVGNFLTAKLRAYFDVIPVKLYKNRLKIPFSPAWVPSSQKLIKTIKELDPDIVHLHWICGGFIKIEDIIKLNKPIIWTMHDMWPFTGGCHYSNGCEKYQDECKYCYILQSIKERDLSNYVFKRKINTYNKIKKIYMVAPSYWIKKIAQKSKILNNIEILNIPNTIDTNLYCQFDKKMIKKEFNFDEKTKIILFGAMNAITDPKKGFDKLLEATRYIKDKNIKIIIFGSKKPNNFYEDKFIFFDKIAEENKLVKLYNISDVVVVPSLEENLSNVIMESLSCGTPVVAFNIGGNSDMIDHMMNGYLAKPFDTKDLYEGIMWVLNNKDYSTLRKNAREKVLKHFSYNAIITKYIKLYEIITKN